MTTQKIKGSLLLTAAALVLTACGGSSGDGGSNPPPPPPTGGITRTGIAVSVGPVTGFGSIIVNGLTYDTDGATFTRDGEAATQDDFAVGEIVVVKGTIDDDNTNAVAESVEFDDNVEGPVTAVTTDTLVVMGQTVRLSATTSIDDSCPAALDDASIVAVEVSGSVDADGVIQATRIECRFVADEFEVTGIVSDHDAANRTFRVNALEVDYSAAAVDDFPGGMISDGDPVEAKGTQFDASGDPDVLVAARVEFKGDRFPEDEGDHLEVEGFITRFASPSDFDVDGIPVTTTTSTVYEGGTAADLGLNLKVEVEGDFNASGVLSATEVEIETSTNVRVSGTVDGVSGNVITILGIAINTDVSSTRFEDQSDADVEPFRIGDINAGDYLDVRGQELPAGEITAVLVERDEAEDSTELRGFVEAGSLNRPTLTVLGVAIDTSGAVFRNSDESPMSADAFWAAVGEGSLIDVDGTEVGPQSLLAEEVELEQE